MYGNNGTFYGGTNVYVTLSHLRSKAKQWYITDVPHLWLTKIFTPFQQESTINNNRISQQQLWNAINIAVIVLYFWIYNVFLDLTLYFCNNLWC